ncbi:MAG: extracellular solute-binding protein family 1 [Paenibacillus sp.]|jgi:multiple sugar transport system substrate-binding protein|nr:extracellular solute-binding protein family 1 [Paenibacillus sp.]
MKKGWNRIGTFLIAGSVFVSGCTKTNQETNDSQSVTKPTEAHAKPVTITIYNAQPGAFDFEKLGIIDAVQKKFPHITLKQILKEKGMDYSDWIAAKTPVDIVYESTTYTVYSIKQFGLETDLQEQIKLQNFNTNVFEPNVLAHALSTNSESKLYGLPFTMNRYGNYYNKTLFDKFGTAYPKDGMTWDDVYELAKKMSRVDAGVNYYGFTAEPHNMLINNQLSLGQLDPKEDKSAMNTNDWKLLFENIRRFWQIPNNARVPTNEAVKGTVAMLIDAGSISKAPVTFDWNVASVPELPQKPKTGFKPASLSLFLSSTSLQPEQAFKVMAYLVSEEFQRQLTRQAIGTPLVNPEVRASFGQDMPQWKNKNVQALYYFPDAPSLPPRDEKLTNVSVHFGELFTTEGDSNTLLRNFDEKVNKAIQDEKARTQKK